ncbi:hypothetical protein DL768_010535 [Monosporascus sp. mg162]|nr:hypothetical protein DL768_010535 [Monosporascus sp. mg162]
MPLSKFREITNTLGELEKKVPQEEAVEQLMAVSFEERLGEEVGAYSGRGNAFSRYQTAIYQELIKMDCLSTTVYFVRKGSQWYKSLPLPPEDSTVDFEGGRVRVCSRNHDAPELSEGRFWSVAFDNELPRKLAELGGNIAIQGELCGSPISQNRESFADSQHQFFVFRIFNIDEQMALCPEEMKRLARKLALEHVPVNGYVRLHAITKYPAIFSSAHGGSRDQQEASRGIGLQEDGRQQMLQGDQQQQSAQKRRVTSREMTNRDLGAAGTGFMYQLWRKGASTGG